MYLNGVSRKVIKNGAHLKKNAKVHIFYTILNALFKTYAFQTKSPTNKKVSNVNYLFSEITRSNLIKRINLN